MLVIAIKPGHDGSIAVVGDRHLLYSLESEKDSFPRYSPLTPSTFLDLAEHVGALPDVVAVGGWKLPGAMQYRPIGAGYLGISEIWQRPMKFFGKDITFFTSSHERSHLMTVLGMSPRTQLCPLQTVLVWEGVTGSFYLVDGKGRVHREVPVLSEPGARYSFLFGLADPGFPDSGQFPPDGDAGKLMALAAFANPEDADKDIRATVDRILAAATVYPAPKAQFRDTPVYNSGVESDAAKTAAALLTQRIFRRFADAARRELPAGTPLMISGGCGLNCEWNARWADFGHFTSVFVPPCPNDSGSAIGTAIDAIAAATGDPHIDWDVYSGLEFVPDTEPDPGRWLRRELDLRALAHEIGHGRVVAWVQGRWEIGPRALGNRSLLAEPFSQQTRDRLNRIKRRESYRPIAPCCRIEDVGRGFRDCFHDPYMLYFREVRAPKLMAVTHVDGSARVQTVSAQTNKRLHKLLTAFAEQHGIGVLCNTSLNVLGHGFINRLSDLARYCQDRGVDDMVVGDVWYQKARGSKDSA